MIVVCAEVLSWGYQKADSKTYWKNNGVSPYCSVDLSRIWYETKEGLHLKIFWRQKMDCNGFLLVHNEGKKFCNMIFPSIATQCSKETGLFFSLRAIEVLRGEKILVFKFARRDLEGSSAAEEILEDGLTS